MILATSDADSLSGYNVFAGSKKSFDLPAWQASKGWDKHSVVRRIAAEFGPQTLEFQWMVDGGVPELPRVSGVDRDLMERRLAPGLALRGRSARPASDRLRLSPG